MLRYLFIVVLFLTNGAAFGQVAGPIYELLEAYRAEAPESPEAQARWANDILAALRANPDEEWSTRIRAYEEAGSVYWRQEDYDRAAPILLEYLQEADERGDTGQVVTSLDHLINLYDEAKYPIEDVLQFYDATENALLNPPPGEEDNYAKILNELYGERAARLQTHATVNAANEEERQRYLEEADYFRGLATGGVQLQHSSTVTLADVARHWFSKEASSRPDALPEVSAAPVVTPPAPPAPVAPSGAEKPVAPLSPKKDALEGAAPVAPAPEAAPADGVSPGVVVLAGVSIIAAGWAIAAYFYLRRKR